MSLDAAKTPMHPMEQANFTAVVSIIVLSCLAPDGGRNSPGNQ